MGGGYWRTLLMIHNWWGGKLNQKERLFRDFLLSDQFYPRRSEIYAAFYWSNSTWINLSTAVRSSSFRGIKVRLLILHVHTIYILYFPVVQLCTFTLPHDPTDPNISRPERSFTSWLTWNEHVHKGKMGFSGRNQPTISCERRLSLLENCSNCRCWNCLYSNNEFIRYIVRIPSVRVVRLCQTDTSQRWDKRQMLNITYWALLYIVRFNPDCSRNIL